MSEDERSAVFNPFFASKTAGKATGLGLSISDGIVREHGGEINVESEAGNGVTFVVTLPFVQPPVQAPDPAPAPLPTPVARRVLVVDDEPALRNALALFLRSLGHQVDIAGSGADALAATSTVQYDGILLDMRMPDMPGEAVYDKLALRDAKQASRVVFVSGDVHSDAVRALLARTGLRCISKPFILEDVASSLFSDPA
jgi:CheY-like chemotaxis protein